MSSEKNCADCDADNGIFNLDNACCRARWMRMHTRVSRQKGAFDTLTKKFGRGAAEKAKEAASVR